VGGGAYRIPRHLLFSGPPVESQMPLYRWPHCAFVSKSLSSISLIRAERTRVGQKKGGLPGQALIALMPLGLWQLSSFLAPCVDTKFDCAIYLVAGANSCSGGSHLHFCYFNDISWIMAGKQMPGRHAAHFRGCSSMCTAHGTILNKLIIEYVKNLNNSYVL